MTATVIVNGLHFAGAVIVLAAIFLVVDYRDRKRRHEDAVIARKRRQGLA